MRTYYGYDTWGVYDGRTATIREIDTWPVSTTFAPLPDIPPGKLARFDGTSWTIIDEHPGKQAELDAKRQSASLSAAKFRLALLAMGELDAVEAAIPQAPREVQIMWEYSTSYERMHPAIVQLGAAMGYSDEQLDQLFGIE